MTRAVRYSPCWASSRLRTTDKRGGTPHARPEASLPIRGSLDQPAQRPDDVGVFRAVTGGDPEELAGLEALLVVAGSGVDPAPDQQTADELLGGEAIAELHQGEIGGGGI